MRFTQAQLREAVGISIETYRHWRTVLPPLYGHKGRAAHFGFGDLVAVAVIRCVVEELGVGISRVASASTPLFAGCRDETWLAQRRQYAVFSLPLRPADTEERIDLSGALISAPELGNELAFGAIIVPVEPIVAALRTKLFDGDIGSASAQRTLPFGPTRLTRSSA
jgi:hypothetical protein